MADTDDDREVMAALEKKYAPLLAWLKAEAGEVVRDGGSLIWIVINVNFGIVVLSDRLVISPCAVVADTTGLTANVQKLMSE